MLRKSIAFGLAFLVVLATGSVVLPSALAALKITTAQTPSTILTASSIGEQKLTVNPNSGTKAQIQCESLTAKATVAETGATSATFTNVGYNSCTATIGASTLPATIDMEGCDYNLHGGEQEGEGHFIGGEADLLCPEGVTGPKITIFSDETHTTKVCTYALWSFTNHGGLTYTNTAGSPADVDFNATNVAVPATRTQGLLCPKAVEEATYNGEATIAAYEDFEGEEGGPARVELSEREGTLQITTAQTPSTILTASSIGEQKLTVNPNSGTKAQIQCESLTAKATVAETGATSATFTNVGYNSCTATIGASTLPATIDMEGCDYNLHGGEQEGEGHFIGGEADLLCPEGVTGPKITIFSDETHTTKVCTYALWSFTNHGGLTYTNTAGSPADVDFNATNVAVPATRTQGLLCPKAVEEATYNGEATIAAYEDFEGEEGGPARVELSEREGTLQITTAQTPSTILTASSIGEQKLTVNPNSGTKAQIQCESLTAKATVAETGATSATFTNVGYNSCTATIGASTLPATIDMEGCDYNLHGGEQEGEGHFIGGEADLLCPEGVTGPKITIFSDETHTTKVCTYALWSFTNHGGLTYTNTAGSPADVDFNATNVAVPATRTQGLLCPKPIEEAAYNGEATIAAYEDFEGEEGGPARVELSG